MARRRMKSKSRKARRGEMSLRDAVIRDFEHFGWKVPKSWRRAATQEKRRRKRASSFNKGRRSRKWIQKAVNPKHKGLLHRALGVPMDRKIPLTKLRRAAKMPGTLGRRARFALNMRKFQRRRRRRE